METLELVSRMSLAKRYVHQFIFGVFALSEAGGIGRVRRVVGKQFQAILR